MKLSYRIDPEVGVLAYVGGRQPLTLGALPPPPALGTQWNLRSRELADLELRACWARMVPGTCVGTEQILRLHLSMKGRAAVSPALAQGQRVVSAS